jgi:hypothetical protein
MDLFEVLWDTLKVMVADDPLGLAITWNFGGSILFQVNVLDPGSDRLAKQQQSIFFGFFPAATILLATAGDDYRCRAVL